MEQLSSTLRGNRSAGGNDSTDGAASGGPAKLEFEEIPTEPGAGPAAESSDKIELGDNEDLPELAVECLDTVNQLVCNWGYKVSALNRTERADLKSFLFRQRVVQGQGSGYLPSDYEMYLATTGEDIMEQEKNIALTPDEKTKLQSKISRVMRDASIKVNNPVAALWGTLLIIMLPRLLPIFTNLLDRMMGKKDKPKREFGKIVEVKHEANRAA